MATRYRHIISGTFARYLRTDASGRVVLRVHDGLVWIDSERFRSEWKECKA